MRAPFALFTILADADLDPDGKVIVPATLELVHNGECESVKTALVGPHMWVRVGPANIGRIAILPIATTIAINKDPGFGDKIVGVLYGDGDKNGRILALLIKFDEERTKGRVINGECSRDSSFEISMAVTLIVASVTRARLRVSVLG